MFYCFIAKPGEKNESRTITKNYYKQKLTKFLRERLGPSMRSRSSAMAPRTLFEGAQDFMLRKLRDQEELQDETFADVTGAGRVSYECAGPSMPVKIAPPIPLPLGGLTYTYKPQDQEEVQEKTYEDVTGRESTSYIQCKYVLVILVRKLRKTSS